LSKTSMWERKDLPDFEGAKALVLPGAFFGSVVSMMAKCGCVRANTVEEADIVVFTGGEDVDPALYKQEPLKNVFFTKTRDTKEEWYFHRAVKQGKLMFGICRGAQFLHVMNGGKLWQDVNNHAGPNHSIIDLEEDMEIVVSSMHHQMLQDNEDLTVMAVTPKQIATTFEDADLKLINPTSEIEIEAGMYEKTHCFFVQGHPEVGPAPFTSWSMWKLYDVYCDHTAVTSPVLDAGTIKALL